ncbi:viroplasmin family protein [Mediannikoviicoccus vaginalis]|uniref:ribonuclease H1 domain-containing protein n=1 Tax=Mediannikoviicoccus vaginalis TaxID=2899727 RepID=UPI001F16B37B|nr:viroplasmin family protein [Mediannikoviicoccus vaginalis]
MGKKKYYAVKVGKNPGIYQTWEQTKVQVEGFSGSVYKSFLTEEEALKFIKEDATVDEELENFEDLNNEISKKIKELDSDKVIAFVDGSYSENADGKEKYSFGAVILSDKKENNLYKAYIDMENINYRNVAGELSGVKEVILWAIDNDKKKITIYYDYEGIEKWATSEWKAKNDLTKGYVKFIDEKKLLIDIEFCKVPAHSGISYNEKADALAKKALLAQGYKTYNDGSVYFVGFDDKKWSNIIEDIKYDFTDEDEKIVYNLERVNDYLNKIKVQKGKEKLTINCYNGQKSYVQGKQSTLFQKLISYAIELLPTDSAVVEVLNTYHAVNIEKDDLENTFSQFLPDFPSNTENLKVRNTLISAVFSTKLIADLPDFTFLVTPVFRAMEYYLHKILNDYLGKETENINSKNNFSFFSINKETKEYYYNSDKKDLNNSQIDYLNRLYNSYNRIRHPYSHWSQDSMDTEVIEDLKTARELIITNLNLINEFYQLYN